MSENNKGGRPKKIPPKERQIAFDDALKMIEEFRKRFNKPGVTRQHLHNTIWRGKLHKWGKSPVVILDKEEVEEVFGLVG